MSTYTETLVHQIFDLVRQVNQQGQYAVSFHLNGCVDLLYLGIEPADADFCDRFRPPPEILSGYITFNRAYLAKSEAETEQRCINELTDMHRHLTSMLTFGACQA
ncbi:hypothetical protein [Pseudomonas sp. GXZC]|uniref:hypothetical protein n=1 Tax=Pseudomonas sp. GXZC TaxID=3003351 RepID=UPI0022AA1595|nr:hypothetical protein [Pseudomonas sp. GXZC]WAT31789.1 hypothetical protein OZ428_16030 [Pseudomonas sp. GXZC]